MRHLTAGLWIFLCLACGRATNSHYQGTPVAKLQGQLVSNTSVALDQPVLLAMAWYPTWAGTAPEFAANAIDMQSNISFQGSFPINFEFHLYDAPPANALADLAAGGGSGRITYGMLIAYEDFNGNGQLDLIQPGGSHVDNIVGVSVGDPSLPPPAASYYIIYLDGTLSASDYYAAFGLQQGYNLIKTHYAFGTEAVPLTSSITIDLTGSSALNYYACPSAFISADSPSSIACGIDPYGGRYQAVGDVYSEALASIGYFWIYDANGEVTNATISMDGTAAPYDASQRMYIYDVASPIPSGPHVVEVSVSGYPSEAIDFTMPDLPTVTAPQEGQTIHTGTPITVAWLATTGAQLYDIYVIAANPSDARLFHLVTTSTSATTPPISFVGAATVGAIAIGAMATGAEGSFLTPVSEQLVDVIFSAP
jgi:hypothetical protein